MIATQVEVKAEVSETVESFLNLSLSLNLRSRQARE
jgi:hypothetical protein